MFSKGLILLLSVTCAFAAPAKQVNLDDIQCRCLTFSTSAAPTHCMYQELLTLDWETAHSLATANDLKIQFASDKAIAKILSIPKPLPTTVLDAIHQGKTLPLDPSKEIRSENRLICGFGNDLEYVESQSAGIKPEIHYVGTVVGLFMLLFIVYLVAEYIWVRCTTRTKRIMLEGEEKALTAEYATCATPTTSQR
ncbi:uncharacterized protein yc1106_09685 [Curvularia clavata]|uniref:Uncharacterized protein n=1 Tax=Curvularia clavata TaxID=95742 RepID=A0A9Q8ZI06_CURCL|nr:uncharacterized protein yc1106_09685 [Curvularia clavata]